MVAASKTARPTWPLHMETAAGPTKDRAGQAHTNAGTEEKAWHEDEAMGRMGTKWEDACLFFIADVCM